jgi:hypothetical protein
MGDVTFDDTAVRRVSPEGRVEQVTWENLAEVRIVTTGEGPFSEDVYWLLVGSDGTGVAVPSSSATDELVERLQALPGFDNEEMIRAMGSTDEGHFTCWQRE